MNANLLALATEAAAEIEKAARENGTAYMAAQGEYGVDVEVMIGGEWMRHQDADDGAEIEAVRLYDCDGNRTTECRTAEEIEAAKAEWMNLLTLAK